MKKHTISVCILLLSSFLLCACSSADSSNDEIVGKWALINNEE